MNKRADEFRLVFGINRIPEINLDGCEIIAVILVYNEMLRIEAFLDHYRKIGVDKFVVVDNLSADGTAEYLRTQLDVELISSSKEFKSYKSAGREIIADFFLDGRWVIFPDADELLIYPGWPKISLKKFIQYLNAKGYEALFTSMVDMYPNKGLKNLSYQAGDNLSKTCPYFDRYGYRFNPLKGSHGKKFKTPVRHIFGGVRERIFHTKTKRRRTWFDNLIMNFFYSINSRAPSSEFQRKIDRLIFKLVKNALPDPAAVQSKVQFLKWKKGYRFSGSVHNVWQDLKLAPEWGALLHFKYLNDYAEKVSEALERKQHTDNAGHYVDYNAQMSRLLNEGLHYSGSALFSGTQSLIDCGLMRESSGFRRWMAENSSGADQDSSKP